MTTLEHKILEKITVYQLDGSFYPIMWSARLIADEFDISLYMARKCMRSLRQKGYIEQTTFNPLWLLVRVRTRM